MRSPSLTWISEFVSDSHDRQPHRFAAADNVLLSPTGLWELRPVHGFGVLVDLFGGLEIPLVAPIVFELALGGGVLTANLGPGLVDSAPIVILKMFTRGVDEQVPGFFIDEHRRPIMQQIPANEVKIFPRNGFVDRQSEIVTTFRRAVIAQVFTLGEISPTANGLRGHGRFENNMGGRESTARTEKDSTGPK